MSFIKLGIWLRVDFVDKLVFQFALQLKRAH